MVAESLAVRQPPLLFEPGRPVGGPWSRQTRLPGWWMRGGQPTERRYHDDPWGAVAQEILIRYVLCGVQRGQLAQEYAMSERAIQEYVSGIAWRAYTEPVLRVLRRMGIGLQRRNRRAREREIARAVCTMAADVLTLLADDPRPLAIVTVETLRVLAAAHDLAEDSNGC